ncbi:MAG: hypothetical protein JWM32_2564 [Verrucomicrobia bacterium]|nr:hypothetical protein [Verrucomicrobiota bacterium]
MALVALACGAAHWGCATALDVNFVIQHNASDPWTWQEGDDDDNPSHSNVASPNYPAYSVSCPYFNGQGLCAFLAVIDTSAPTGHYYLGTFPSGSDTYVTVY